MCGIFGCILKEEEAAPIIHESLKRLEYRGYDSCGVATVFKGNLWLKKNAGKIDEVHRELNLDDMPGYIGIGHTRWATHGAPTKENAHPHTDCSGKIAVVHNGIIENFAELRRELEAKGHKFKSKTDTEVIPHLIEEFIKKGFSFPEAVREAIKKLKGSYAIAVIHANENVMVCARKESPLVIGLSKKGIFCASDIPAFLPYTNNVIVVEDGEIAILTADGYEIRRVEDWVKVNKKPKMIDWTVDMAEKKGFPHFMIKEIHEQPLCLKNTLRLREEYLDLMTTFLDRAKELFLIACGTSYHACFAASYLFAKLARRTAHPVIASEFIENYGNAIGVESTILAVSQSGETADTLNALLYARDKAATILGLTNVIGSTLTRIARVYICQQSGPEIGVAATKTYTSQLSVLTQLAIKLGMKRGKIGHIQYEELTSWIKKIPDITENVIENCEEKIMNIAEKYVGSRNFIFVGKGVNVATAMEGRLKLLEIAYMPSIAYSTLNADEIKFIGKETTAVFICPKTENRKRTMDEMSILKELGARIIALIEEGDAEIIEIADDYIEIPHIPLEELTPIPYIIPLQLLAYYVSVKKGLNPDMPRNLAKSVTVL